MSEDMLDSLPIEPPRLMRSNAIDTSYETTANQMEDYRIAQETLERNARNPDNVRADFEAQNPNRGGRKSRRRRRRRGSKRSRRSRRHRRR